jgi:hypothetical protein
VLAQPLGLDEQPRGAAEQQRIVDRVVGRAPPVLPVDLVGVQDVPAERGDDRLDQPGLGVGLPDALAEPPVAVDAFHALLEGVEQVVHGFLPVVGSAPWSTELPVWAVRPSRRSSLDRGSWKSTRFRSGALSCIACPARSTTRSTFYLVLPAPTLTAGFPELRWLYRTTLAFRPPPDYGSGVHTLDFDVAGQARSTAILCARNQ